MFVSLFLIFFDWIDFLIFTNIYFTLVYIFNILVFQYHLFVPFRQEFSFEFLLEIFDSGILGTFPFLLIEIYYYLEITQADLPLSGIIAIPWGMCTLFWLLYRMVATWRTQRSKPQEVVTESVSYMLIN